MTDAVTALEKAIYAALSDPGAVSAAVYSHAPQDSAYPMVIVGDIENVQPIARADDPDRRMTVSILCLTQGEERKPCSALVDQVEAALRAGPLEESPWRIALSLETVSVTLAEDGLGYVGLAQFSVLALMD